MIADDGMRVITRHGQRCTSWETYNQGLDRSCFACHNGSFATHSTPFPQADFSHLFAGMAIAGTGACKTNPSYPGTCPKPAAVRAK